MFKPEHFDELNKLITNFSWESLRSNPNSDLVQDWIAEVNGLLWEFDGPSSEEFQKKINTLKNLWGGVNAGTLPNYDLSHDISDIKQFLKSKLVGMRREKEKIFSGEKVPTQSKQLLKFGEPGQPGQPGGGGSVYIQAERFNVAGTGRISADGGDYISQKDVTNSSIQTGDINVSNSDISNSFKKIRGQIPKKVESSNQARAIELLNILEEELKKDDKKTSKITKIFGQIKKISKWLASQLIQGAVGSLIKTYLPPIVLSELS